MYDKYVKNGYSQLIALKSPGDMTRRNLKKWWFEHAERVKKLKGLRLYTIVFTEEKTFGPPKPFDGFEEMFFNTLDDLKEAYNSGIWQSELTQMEEEYLYHPMYFKGVWLESYIVKMAGLKTEVPDKSRLIRQVGALKRHKNMNKKELKDWFYLHATMALDEKGIMTIPGIIGYTHSFAIISPYGPAFIDAIGGNWWNNLEEIKRDFNAPKMSSQVAHGNTTWDYYDLNQAQMTWGEQFVIGLK